MKDVFLGVSAGAFGLALVLAIDPDFDVNVLQQIIEGILAFLVAGAIHIRQG